MRKKFELIIRHHKSIFYTPFSFQNINPSSLEYSSEQSCFCHKGCALLLLSQDIRDIASVTGMSDATSGTKYVLLSQGMNDVTSVTRYARCYLSQNMRDVTSVTRYARCYFRNKICAMLFQSRNMCHVSCVTR